MLIFQIFLLFFNKRVCLLLISNYKIERFLNEEQLTKHMNYIAPPSTENKEISTLVNKLNKLQKSRIQRSEEIQKIGQITSNMLNQEILGLHMLEREYAHQKNQELNQTPRCDQYRFKLRPKTNDNYPWLAKMTFSITPEKHKEYLRFNDPSYEEIILMIPNNHPCVLQRYPERDIEIYTRNVSEDKLKNFLETITYTTTLYQKANKPKPLLKKRKSYHPQ